MELENVGYWKDWTFKILAAKLSQDITRNLLREGVHSTHGWEDGNRHITHNDEHVSLYPLNSCLIGLDLDWDWVQQYQAACPYTYTRGV